MFGQKSQEIAKKFAPLKTVLDFGGYLSVVLAAVGITGAAMMGWLTGTLQSLWLTFGTPGIVIGGIILWVLLLVALELHREAVPAGRSKVAYLLLFLGIACIVVAAILFARERLPTVAGSQGSPSQPSTTAPVPPKPSNERSTSKVAILHGPYLPAEVATMILAHGQMQDHIEKILRPAVMKLSGVGSLLAKWPASKGEELADEIDAVRNELQTANADLQKISFNEYSRFHTELWVAVDEKYETLVGPVIRNLGLMADNIRSLAKSSPRDQHTVQIVARDYSRIDEAMFMLPQSLARTLDNIKVKTRLLRDYKP